MVCWSGLPPAAAAADMSMDGQRLGPDDNLYAGKSGRLVFANGFTVASDCHVRDFEQDVVVGRRVSRAGFMKISPLLSRF